MSAEDTQRPALGLLFARPPDAWAQTSEWLAPVQRVGRIVGLLVDGTAAVARLHVGDRAPLHGAGGPVAWRFASDLLRAVPVVISPGYQISIHFEGTRPTTVALVVEYMDGAP